MATAKYKKGCLTCPYETDNEKDYLKHIKTHQFEYNFKFQCFNCSTTIKNVKNYERHRRDCKTFSTPIIPPLPETMIDGNIAAPIIDPLPETMLDGNVAWKCSICEEIIQIQNEPNEKDFDLVKTHCYKHAMKGQVACPSCEKVYDPFIYQVYVNHMNKHRKMKQFEGVDQYYIKTQKIESVQENLNNTAESAESLEILDVNNHQETLQETQIEIDHFS